ncbi:MAG: hypothetical protein JST79_18385 [Acidobacteria bacterium]|nr:hypothetical protein [Acidobacteriota bacterium]
MFSTVGAILLIDAPPLPEAMAGAGCRASSRPHQFVLGSPSACLEILGASLVQRTLQNLQAAGIGHVAVLCRKEAALPIREAIAESAETPPTLLSADTGDDFWLMMERAQQEMRAKHVEWLFVVNLDTYTEFEPEPAIRHSLRHGSGPVQIIDRKGPLGIWLRNLTREAPRPGTVLEWLVLEGYSNRLTTMSDLRRFVMDMFHFRCASRPGGEPRKPGVWIDRGARVHRRARIVAPAYIGKNTTICAETVITRSSSIERDCVVDYGSVVEDSCLLPGTYVGPELDVASSIVDRNRILHLQHNATLEVHDSMLVGAARSRFRPDLGRPGGQPAESQHRKSSR